MWRACSTVTKDDEEDDKGLADEGVSILGVLRIDGEKGVQRACSTVTKDDEDDDKRLADEGVSILGVLRLDGEGEDSDVSDDGDADGESNSCLRATIHASDGAPDPLLGDTPPTHVGFDDDERIAPDSGVF